jgi:uncharacterized protein YggU (UPF0235/DUF167 family)
MELIYFISGILTVGTVYGVLLLRKVKSSHTELLESSSQLLDLTQTTRENVLGKFNDANKRMIRINEENEKLIKQMNDDAYVGNTELNQRITDLAKVFNQQGNANKKLFDVADSQFRKINSDIQILNGALKRFQDDPNLKARY